MKLTFANRNYSSWSLRAWLVPKHFGISFQEELALLNGEGWKENIRRLSPSGRVPVVIDGDLVIPETLAIIEYLAESFPEKPIWPRGRADRALARSAASEMHAGFAALRKGRADESADLASGQGRRRYCRRGPEAHRGAVVGPARPFGRAIPARRVQCRRCDACPGRHRIRTYQLPASNQVQEYVEVIYALPAFQDLYAEAVREPWIVEDHDVDIIRARAAAP